MTIEEIVSRYDSIKEPETLEIYYEDIFPESLFRTRHPNYSEKEFQYIKDNYLNPVKSKFGEALFQVKKVFSEGNYSIECEDANIVEYLKKLNLIDWFKNIYTDATILDPSLLLTFHLKESELNVDEEGNIKPNESLPMYPYLVRSRDIIYSGSDKIIYRIKGNQRYNFISIEKIGRSILYSQYNIADVKDAKPTILAKIDVDLSKIFRKGDGIKAIKDNELTIQSYFEPAKPILNFLLSKIVKKEIVETRMLFATPWMITEDCECDNGESWEYNDKGEQCKVTCKICKGTSKKQSFNVHSTVEIPIQRNLIDGKGQIQPPGMGYVDYPTNGYDALTVSIENDLKRAFKWLINDYSETNAHGSPTALGKMIDREERFSTLSLYSQDLFETIRWWVNDICIPLVFTSSKSAVKINVYNNFRTTSTAEINALLAELQKDNAPTNIVRDLVRDFYNAKNETNKFLVVDKYYLYKNTALCIQMVASGNLSKQAFTISENIMKWVDYLDLDKYESLDDAAMNEIDSILIEKANQLMPAPAIATVESFV